MLGKKKRNVTDERRPRPPPQRIRIPFATMLRMFLLGMVAVIGACYAIWRHYTVPYTPMLRYAPSATATPSATEHEIEIEPP